MGKMVQLFFILFFFKLLFTSFVIRCDKKQIHCVDNDAYDWVCVMDICSKTKKKWISDKKNHQYIIVCSQFGRHMEFSMQLNSLADIKIADRWAVLYWTVTESADRIPAAAVHRFVEQIFRLFCTHFPIIFFFFPFRLITAKETHQLTQFWKSCSKKFLFVRCSAEFGLLTN